MYKIELTKKSKSTLDLLNSVDKNNFISLCEGLQNLQSIFPNTSQVKNIGDNIFRKRVGRWRILFTVDKNIIVIWIIEIEKDTKKDYAKWKSFIIKNIKN